MSDTSLADRVDSFTDSATKNVEELTGATKDFVESNNLVTKFVFILGVFITVSLWNANVNQFNGLVFYGIIDSLYIKRLNKP